jgi:hypothetical protein
MKIAEAQRTWDGRLANIAKTLDSVDYHRSTVQGSSRIVRGLIFCADTWSFFIAMWMLWWSTYI